MTPLHAKLINRATQQIQELHLDETNREGKFNEIAVSLKDSRLIEARGNDIKVEISITHTEGTDGTSEVFENGASIGFARAHKETDFKDIVQGYDLIVDHT